MNTSGATDHDNGNNDGTKGTATYAKGNVYHVMNSGSMQVILINDILSLDKNLEHFENLYFAQNYTQIKNSIVNSLKAKYVVSYY